MNQQSGSSSKLFPGISQYTLKSKTVIWEAQENDREWTDLRDVCNREKVLIHALRDRGIATLGQLAVLREQDVRVLYSEWKQTVLAKRDDDLLQLVQRRFISICKMHEYHTVNADIWASKDLNQLCDGDVGVIEKLAECGVVTVNDVRELLEEDIRMLRLSNIRIQRRIIEYATSSPRSKVRRYHKPGSTIQRQPSPTLPLPEKMGTAAAHVATAAAGVQTRGRARSRSVGEADDDAPLQARQRSRSGSWAHASTSPKADGAHSSSQQSILQQPPWIP